MVPLEAGLPNPPGFSVELLKSREEGRLFLIQLPNGFKVVPYENLDPVNAALPRYQQCSVNCLAFLAKYQLHGILCDETHSPDAIHLPSLTICPPMLTGHCNYEILKYVENFRPTSAQYSSLAKRANGR
ncbi:hypothetical protein FB107DRAFT_280713 [Schizophyllum commune]